MTMKWHAGNKAGANIYQFSRIMKQKILCSHCLEIWLFMGLYPDVSETQSSFECGFQGEFRDDPDTPRNGQADIVDQPGVSTSLLLSWRQKKSIHSKWNHITSETNILEAIKSKLKS